MLICVPGLHAHLLDLGIETEGSYQCNEDVGSNKMSPVKYPVKMKRKLKKMNAQVRQIVSEG